MTGPADSAGNPFHGRQVTGSGFDGDTGAADAALVAALEHPSDERTLVATVATARLLVPVVAEPAEVEDSGELVPLGLEGAIVGKALYAGAFTLPEALDVAGRP